MGFESPLAKQEAGARPQIPDGGSGGSELFTCCHSSSPAPPFGPGPSLEHLQMFFSPLEKPPHTSCRQEHPWALLTATCPTGARTPLPTGVTVSPGPCSHPALHRHKPVVAAVSQTRLRSGRSKGTLSISLGLQRPSSKHLVWGRERHPRAPKSLGSPPKAPAAQRRAQHTPCPGLCSLLAQASASLELVWQSSSGK